MALIRMLGLRHQCIAMEVTLRMAAWVRLVTSIALSLFRGDLPRNVTFASRPRRNNTFGRRSIEDEGT